jgi:hypothetical protein
MSLGGAYGDQVVFLLQIFAQINVIFEALTATSLQMNANNNRMKSSIVAYNSYNSHFQ